METVLGIALRSVGNSPHHISLLPIGHGFLPVNSILENSVFCVHCEQVVHNFLTELRGEMLAFFFDSLWLLQSSSSTYPTMTDHSRGRQSLDVLSYSEIYEFRMRFLL